MKRKRLLSMLVGAVMTTSLLLTGCGQESGNNTDGANAQILKVGFGSSIDNSSGGQGLKKFKELLETESNGKFKV